jgi:DNA polymerase-3 subunit gamma/tau
VKQGRAEGPENSVAVSLYRTWRPKSFADLVGQDAVVRTLRTALSSGKLAHAYLFSGPRGSGKTSAAKILARCINCVHGPTPDPDNNCENCLAILAGAALDVIEVDAASNRGIEEIRALRESVKFAPASMRMKVFIIDEAHMLTREGANAFLRTLEEPPAHAVFILATTAPEALPPTILSRCQRYAFRRIPVAVMIERMREIAAAEGIPIDDAALGALAYRADGGLRDALTMLEQVAAYSGANVDVGTVEAAFGTTGRQFARALVEAILAGRAADALRTVAEASDAGADMFGLLRGAIGEYRNLLIARIEPELLGRDLSAADAEAVAAAAAGTPQPKIVRGLRLLADALAAGRLSGSPRLELETALLRLIVATEDPSLEALASRVALLEQGAGQSSVAGQGAERPKRSEPAASAQPAAATPAAATAPTVPAPAVTTVPPPAGRVPTLQQVRSLWDQIRLRADERHKPLKGPLSGATVDAVDATSLTIGVSDALQETIARDKLPILEDAVAEVLGVKLRVVIRSRAPATSAHRAPPPPPPPSASGNGVDGESDLLAYARRKLGRTEST